MSISDQSIRNAMPIIDKAFKKHLDISDTSPIVLRLIAWFLLSSGCSYPNIVEQDTVFKARKNYSADRAADDFFKFKKNKLVPALRRVGCKVQEKKINKKRLFLILKEHCYLEVKASGNELKGLMHQPLQVCKIQQDDELLELSESYFFDPEIPLEKKEDTFSNISDHYTISTSIAAESNKEQILG